MVKRAWSRCPRRDAPSMDVKRERDLIGRDGVPGPQGVTDMYHQDMLVHLFVHDRRVAMFDCYTRHLLTRWWLFFSLDEHSFQENDITSKLTTC